MVTLSSSMLIVLLIAGGITTLAMLSVFANVIGHETQLHDLRNRVKDLQFQHAMYLARINGQIADEGNEAGHEIVEELEGIEFDQTAFDENAFESAPDSLPISAPQAEPAVATQAAAA